jgi:hypothetical protein
MRCFILLAFFCSLAFSALATAADLAPDEIIQKFAAKEAEFRKAKITLTGSP